MVTIIKNVIGFDSLLTLFFVAGFEPVGLHLTVKLIFGRLRVLLVIYSNFAAVVSAATLFKWLLVVPLPVTAYLTCWFIFGIAKCLQIDVLGTVAHLDSLLTILFEAALWPERSTFNSSSSCLWYLPALVTLLIFTLVAVLCLAFSGGTRFPATTLLLVVSPRLLNILSHLNSILII